MNISVAMVYVRLHLFHVKIIDLEVFSCLCKMNTFIVSHRIKLEQNMFLLFGNYIFSSSRGGGGGRGDMKAFLLSYITRVSIRDGEIDAHCIL